ncbi:MAG: PepSY-associated TM helix domain-containing protein, partial [Xanthomonadales bacterium]|nr:PepSY-associated TM helix domain-containing protein [Xanthomonadales bacterium]
MVRLPRNGIAAYHVFLDGGQALVDPKNHALIDEWAWHQTFVGILSELHFHLAAGRIGKNTVGALGLAAGLMAISGLLLWWVVRHQFRWRSLRPTGPGRGHLLRLHRDLGALAAVFVLLFGLTGAAVVFGSASRTILNTLLLSPVVSQARPEVRATQRPGPPDAQMLAAARSALPQSRLISWSPPPAGSAVHYLRLRMPGEPHPNGRSTVYLDGLRKTVIEHIDASRAPRGESVLNWMYPLHSLQIGGWPYRVLGLLTALALAVISLSGLWSFVQWLRHKRAH